MAAFVGADVEQLELLATRFDRSADRIDAILRDSSTRLRTAQWVGADVQALRSSWDGQSRPALASASAQLRGAAKRLQWEAAAQRAASAAQDGAPISGAFTARVGAKAAGSASGVAPGPGEYQLGPPIRPEIEWDEDFIYNSEDSNLGDHAAKLEWMAKLNGARLLRADLDDGTAAYAHYWSNTGDHFTFDYEEAYREDDGVRLAIDNEIARTTAAVNDFVEQGHQDFSITGGASATDGYEYPRTENWQKAIGGHQLWSSADVTVADGMVRMEVVVTGEDYYNFNRGQADIASQAPDSANGRFTEIGWARPFPQSGTVTRVIEWEVGSPDSPTVVSGGEPPRDL